MQVTIDQTKYDEAAHKWKTPRAIFDEGDYRDALKIVEALMDADERTPEETELLKTWGQLVATYEDSICPTPDVSPEAMIRFLLEQRGLKPAALVPSIFSSRGHASEVINGNREISKEVAMRLAGFFDVPVDFFLKPKAMTTGGHAKG
jgi:antitoxin component HigA of HigAB toxin-antitoxin module